MFGGAHTDLTVYEHKKCYGCNVSTVIFKLNPCNTCNIDYCYDCWNSFIRTCKCSAAKSNGFNPTDCLRAVCQKCKNRDSILCCGKNKYCKSRYFGYCDNCFGARLISLYKQDILPVSRGYLIYIIEQYIVDLQMMEGDSASDSDNIFKQLIEVYHEYKSPTNTVEVYRFTDEHGERATLDKLTKYIWNGYVDDNDMGIMDLYVKEIVLRKYISMFGLTDINRNGQSNLHKKNREVIDKLIEYQRAIP